MDATTPLGDITEPQLKSLYETLWDWRTCGSCTTSASCGTTECPTRRADRLGPFQAFYRQTTERYIPEFDASTEIALRSHDDLIDIIRCIKQQPSMDRETLMETYFARRSAEEGQQETPNQQDQRRAFNMAVRILTMINCSAENQADALLEEGTRPITWINNDSLVQFINKSFPTTDHPTLNDSSQAEKAMSLKSSLEARRLTKMAGLSFRGTDNLANHLHMDVERGFVEIFHHTRVLKEHLMATQGSGNGLVQDGTHLPRQLALEVIDSIQKILFPLESPSEPLLRTLVVKQGFDPDCLRLVESTSYRRPTEHNIPYHYFGGRLMDLAHEVEHPTARGLLDKWLERKSGARYVMLATLAGVAVAILLGFLSLGVSVFQAWVSWEAWKYPSAS